MTFEDHVAADLRRTAVSRVCTAISSARLQAVVEGLDGVAQRLRAIELDVAREAVAEDRAMRVAGGARE